MQACRIYTNAPLGYSSDERRIHTLTYIQTCIITVYMHSCRIYTNAPLWDSSDERRTHTPALGLCRSVECVYVCMYVCKRTCIQALSLCRSVIKKIHACMYVVGVCVCQQKKKDETKYECVYGLYIYIHTHTHTPSMNVVSLCV